MKNKKPYTGTQAVLRAISLLKVFSEDHPVWSLNKTTTFRLLTALESEGFIVRSPNADTYMLGPEIVVLGGQALRSNNLRSVSRPELRFLAEATGETTSLEVLSGHQVVIIDEILGEHLVSGVPSVGTRWPALATSTGKAILAHLQNDQLDVILKKPLTKFTPKTITSIDALRRELLQIRKQGFAIADETLELGFIAIGSAVKNHDREVVAAISVGGPRIRFTTKRIPQIAFQVRETADRISAALGFKA
jgi:IclR family transcriptional regulator, acetate operon repressor